MILVEIILGGVLFGLFILSPVGVIIVMCKMIYAKKHYPQMYWTTYCRGRPIERTNPKYAKEERELTDRYIKYMRIAAVVSMIIGFIIAIVLCAH